jgi:superfamily II DNA or RNA helicase
MNSIIEDFGYYPLVSEVDFQEKLLYHTEFHSLIYPIIEDKNLTDAEKILLIKAKILTATLTLTPYQEFVSRFISSYTPYTSLLLFHSPGSGKTLCVLKMLKNNINFIINQNSSVYIIVSRRLLKQQWIGDIANYEPNLIPYIKLITYKSLYNKVIGEKRVIVEQDTLEVKLNK